MFPRDRFGSSKEVFVKQRDNLKRHFFLAAIVISLILLLGGELLLLPLLRYFQSRISDEGTIFLMRYSLSLGIWPTTLLYCKYAEKDTFNSFKIADRGGRKGNTFKNLLIGLFTGFVLNGLCALTALLHGDLSFSFSSFDIIYLVIGLIAVFIQSGAEELVARGYLYSVIESRYGVVTAFVTNTLFFTVLHGGNHGITFLAVSQMILISILLSIFVWHYDSLWMAMGLHTAWNYTQSLLLGLPNSGIVSQKSLLHLDAASDSIFYSAAFGLEGGITASVLLIVIISFIFFRIKRSRPGIF